MPGNDALQKVLDKQEIMEVVGVRYARPQEWGDLEQLKDCFHADAEVEYGFFNGNAHEWAETVLSPESHSTLRRWHFMGNILVQVDGDKADAEAYGFSVGTMKNNNGACRDDMFGGRYLIRLERREGQWKISWLRFLLDWMQSLPSGIGEAADGPQHGQGGALPLSDGYDINHPLYRPMRR